MNSILTNNSAMMALRNLSLTQKNLSVTQSQISSGLAVATASDNAAYWSISTSMKSDVGALGAVTDALNLGASVLATATAAMSSVETILSKMKADIVTARTSGTDPTQIQTDIAAQQKSLISIMNSASFNGVNLLDGSSPTASIVDSFSRNGNGDTTIGTLTIDTATIVLGSDTAIGGGLIGGDIAGLSSGSTGTGSPAGLTSGTYSATSTLGFTLSSATTSNDLTLIANTLDAQITSVTAGTALLGQYTTNVNNQLSFTSALSDSLTSGVGSLVDADMNVASTRLQALQTQQQLGIQALSIANQNSQLLLKLFQ